MTQADNELVAQGIANISRIAPAIFTADGSGSGVPAALAALYRGDTVESVPVVKCVGRCVAAPMPLGSADQVLVVSLYATGIRNGERASSSVGEVLFAGVHPTIPGLDQINLRLGRELAGRGEFDIVITVDGRAANTVRVAVR